MLTLTPCYVAVPAVPCNDSATLRRVAVHEAFRRNMPQNIMLGNEHLSLQAGLCKLPRSRNETLPQLVYSHIIPIESLSGEAPNALKGLADHLRTDLIHHPFLHAHASAGGSAVNTAHPSSAELAQDDVVDKKTHSMLKRIESIYREDIEVLARLVHPDYPLSSAAAGTKVAGILRHDAGGR